MNAALVFFVAIVCICVATPVAQWQQFKQTYKRSYDSQREEIARFQTFVNNVKIAEDLNAKDPHAQYGITKFMDLSPEEFREQYLISNFTSPKLEGKPYPTLPQANVSFSQLPVAFDWRQRGVVGGVYNQGQCGSCWAFSTAENVESLWAIAKHPLPNLSMQQLVDCDHNDDHGCNGGNPPNAYQYIIAAKGLDSFQAYPYAGVDQACRFNPASVAARISKWGYITTIDNENLMGAWTYQYGPPSICVDAQYWQYYQGGVVTANCGNQLDHCVQLTGWETISNIPAWNVRNSWGVDWGYAGYIYIMRGANICGIGEEVTSCVI